MEQIEKLATLRERREQWRREGLRVGFVPTMGNLHAGHRSLIHEAARRAERVVASIFVNPMQFGAGEDFASYPRTLERDAQMLRDAGCDLLFAPAEAVVYPRERDGQTLVEVPGLSDELCGASRPGHFSAVATVVTKLFNMVQPEVALFGEKDFQQLLVIRRLVNELDLPIEIVGAPILREPDGLAMSSRNGYLSAAQRAIAPQLRVALLAAVQRLQGGADCPTVEQETEQALAAAGLAPDYVSVRRRSDLSRPDAALSDLADRALIILAAAQLGRARLIDNLACDPAGDPAC